MSNSFDLKKRVLPILKEVLIIEDDDMDYKLLIDEMNRQETIYRFTRSKTLALSEQLLAENRYDLIILDLGLPDSQGLATYHAIIQANKFNTKIIIADASIVDRNVITQHLSTNSVEPDKIFFRTASNQSELPLSTEVFKFLNLKFTCKSY